MDKVNEDIKQIREEKELCQKNLDNSLTEIKNNILTILDILTVQKENQDKYTNDLYLYKNELDEQGLSITTINSKLSIFSKYNVRNLTMFIIVFMLVLSSFVYNNTSIAKICTSIESERKLHATNKIKILNAVKTIKNNVNNKKEVVDVRTKHEW